MPVNSSNFYVRFRDMPVTLGMNQVSEMQKRARIIVGEEVLPAFKDLGDFIKNEYRSELYAAMY